MVDEIKPKVSPRARSFTRDTASFWLTSTELLLILLAICSQTATTT